MKRIKQVCMGISLTFVLSTSIFAADAGTGALVGAGEIDTWGNNRIYSNGTDNCPSCTAKGVAITAQDSVSSSVSELALNLVQDFLLMF